MEKDWGWLAVVDWLAVKTEYVTTAIGYRELSKKHRIRYKTLADRAKAEGWVEARHQYREKAITAAENAMAEQHAVRAVKFQGVADRLLREAYGDEIKEGFFAFHERYECVKKQDYVTGKWK